ncbi:sigma factor [Streptomyces tsukubensis]|uniref:sigma factor n=1 Tax=Streptomyces tsukubensis TaxID=83656 RepID=UPI0036C9735D
MESNDEHGRSDALLKRAARDPDAFTVLVEEVSPALHGYLARRAPGAADDLLAEAWLQAFAARRTFDASRGLGARMAVRSGPPCARRSSPAGRTGGRRGR